ncbi:class I SAM-dependent methyltransferase [Arcanobacterium bovis]|uniref:class I SAM-dependent methyltransferase n=1 Tax=Arcanobacterium bovis TaxID=2529275 RepID=UPI0013F152D5|nr:class I SAM-dependent methyltransferase [Arcanobacterium bovis]
MSIKDLLSGRGAELLESLPPYSETSIFGLTEQLRKAGHEPHLISEALTQSRLRAKAQAKFGDFSSGLYFTPAGLEQATRLNVAAFHAQRFREEAQSQHVLDFGCGIGADSIAFAGLNLNVTAVEMDDDAAAAASANLRYFPGARVIHADGNSLDLASLGTDALWVDPARRQGGKRIKDPEQWYPALSSAIAMAAEFASAGIKIAPGIDYTVLPRKSHVQWISVDGDLVEAVVWLGDAAPQAGRSALILKDGRSHVFDSGSSDPRLPAIELEPKELGDYIFEPDPAIIRSGSIMALADQHKISPVSSRIAYLTGDDEILSPFVSTFKVECVCDLNPKVLRKTLAEKGIGRVEIKKRGTDILPEELRKKLKLDPKQPHAATIIATPLLGKHRAVISTRISER